MTFQLCGQSAKRVRLEIYPRASGAGAIVVRPDQAPASTLDGIWMTTTPPLVFDRRHQGDAPTHAYFGLNFSAAVGFIFVAEWFEEGDSP
jgi:hypothetical protein